MLSKCLLHCETVILVLYFTTGKTLKANNTYTKFLCVKKPNRICETTYGLRDTIMKDLVILGTDSLFLPLTFISLSWGKERDNKIKRQGVNAKAI